MNNLRALSWLVLGISTILLVRPLAAQDADDVADVKSQDLHVGNDDHMHYFLIGPKTDAKTPADGLGLIIIMPGGDGSADFNPFVKRIFKFALPDRYLVAEPVAVKWTPNQQIVWPTAKAKASGAKFTTEDFVNAVIEDVAKREKIIPKRVFTLSWSSSGPAAYAISTSKGKVAGSFIAMSVFHPSEITLANAKGHNYYLYQSPDDQVCRFSMAEQAEKALNDAGATVKLTKYDGGHGWHGNVFGDIREGFDWLERNSGN
jgi:predicted esterase